MMHLRLKHQDTTRVAVYDCSIRVTALSVFEIINSFTRLNQYFTEQGQVLWLIILQLHYVMALKL